MKENSLVESTRRVLGNRRFLQGTWVFGELIGFSVERAISAAMERISVSAGKFVDHGPGAFLFLLEKGEIDLLREGRPCEKLGPGAFWGEEVALGRPRLFRGRAAADSVVFAIPAPLIADVPIVQWRLLQTAEKRSYTAAKK
jgi:hemerythrin